MMMSIAKELISTFFEKFCILYCIASHYFIYLKILVIFFYLSCILHSFFPFIILSSLAFLFTLHPFFLSYSSFALFVKQTKNKQMLFPLSFLFRTFLISPFSIFSSCFLSCPCFSFPSFLLSTSFYFSK